MSKANDEKEIIEAAEESIVATKKLADERLKDKKSADYSDLQSLDTLFNDIFKPALDKHDNFIRYSDRVFSSTGQKINLERLDDKKEETRQLNYSIYFLFHQLISTSNFGTYRLAVNSQITLTKESKIYLSMKLYKELIAIADKNPNDKTIDAILDVVKEIFADGFIIDNLQDDEILKILQTFQNPSGVKILHQMLSHRFYPGTNNFEAYNQIIKLPKTLKYISENGINIGGAATILHELNPIDEKTALKLIENIDTSNDKFIEFDISRILGSSTNKSKYSDNAQKAFLDKYLQYIQNSKHHILGDHLSELVRIPQDLLPNDKLIEVLQSHGEIKDGRIEYNRMNIVYQRLGREKFEEIIVKNISDKNFVSNNIYNILLFCTTNKLNFKNMVESIIDNTGEKLDKKTLLQLFCDKSLTKGGVIEDIAKVIFESDQLSEIFDFLIDDSVASIKDYSIISFINNQVFHKSLLNKNLFNKIKDLQEVKKQYKWMNLSSYESALDTKLISIPKGEEANFTNKFGSFSKVDMPETIEYMQTNTESAGYNRGMTIKDMIYLGAYTDAFGFDNDVSKEFTTLNGNSRDLHHKVRKVFEVSEKLGIDKPYRFQYRGHVKPFAHTNAFAPSEILEAIFSKDKEKSIQGCNDNHKASIVTEYVLFKKLKETEKNFQAAFKGTIDLDKIRGIMYAAIFKKLYAVDPKDRSKSKLISENLNELLNEGNKACDLFFNNIIGALQKSLDPSFTGTGKPIDELSLDFCDAKDDFSMVNVLAEIFKKGGNDFIIGDKKTFNNIVTSLPKVNIMKITDSKASETAVQNTSQSNKLYDKTNIALGSVTVSLVLAVMMVMFAKHLPKTKDPKSKINGFVNFLQNLSKNQKLFFAAISGAIAVASAYLLYTRNKKPTTGNSLSTGTDSKKTLADKVKKGDNTNFQIK